MGILIRVFFIVCVLVGNNLLAAEEGSFFLKASKSVPRIGRNNPNKNENKNNNDENFEKFFLKASKSVPRIGRRGGNPGGFDSIPPNEVESRNNEISLTYPYSWTSSDIADFYEFNPQLFSLPHLFQGNIGESEIISDNRNTYDWENVKLKRLYPELVFPFSDNDREKLEPRFQPEMK